MRKKSDQAKCCGINIPVRGTSRGKVHEMGKSLALSRNRKSSERLLMQRDREARRWKFKRWTQRQKQRCRESQRNTEHRESSAYPQPKRDRNRERQIDRDRDRETDKDRGKIGSY